MRRAFASPAAFKASLEDRLRSRAVSVGTDLQRLRQLVVYDRFLARLFLDSGDVVLKGGLALELRCERARATKDVDVQMMGEPAATLTRLQEMGRRDLGDFLAYEVATDVLHPEINADGLVYEGRRYRVEARLAGKVYGRPFGVDVAFAEPLHGAVELLLGEPWLAFAGIAPVTVRAYPLVSHVAEKLHAYTMPRPRPNSRVKDLPDIALLAGVRRLDGAELRGTIDACFVSRGTHVVPARLPTPPEGWEAAYREMAEAEDLPWPTLDALVPAVRAFLDPVLAGEGRVWDPGRWAWV